MACKAETLRVSRQRGYTEPMRCVGSGSGRRAEAVAVADMHAVGGLLGYTNILRQSAKSG